MDDFDFNPRDVRAAADEGRSSGPLGGFTLQTGASVLLIAVIAAVLWLFLGPMPDADPGAGLPTATAEGQPTLAALPVDGPHDPAANVTPAAEGDQLADPNATIDATSPDLGSIAAGAVAEGTFIEISNTGGLGVRFRFGPGSDYLTIRIVDDGETLKVLGPAQQADGLTWWRLQDANGHVGWTAEEFLRPVAMPPAWNPPVASPTFQVQSEGGLEATPVAP